MGELAFGLMMMFLPAASVAPDWSAFNDPTCRPAYATHAYVTPSSVRFACEPDSAKLLFKAGAVWKVERSGPAALVGVR